MILSNYFIVTLTRSSWSCFVPMGMGVVKWSRYKLVSDFAREGHPVLVLSLLPGLPMETSEKDRKYIVSALVANSNGQPSSLGY